MNLFSQIKNLDNNFIYKLINNDLNKKLKNVEIFDELAENNYFIVDEVELSIPKEDIKMEYSDFIKKSDRSKVFLNKKYSHLTKEETVDNLNALSYFYDLIKDKYFIILYKFIECPLKKIRVKMSIDDIDTIVITNNIGKDDLLNLLLQNKYSIISLKHENDDTFKLYKVSIKKGFETFESIVQLTAKKDETETQKIDREYKEYNKYFYSPENVESLLKIFKKFTKKDNEILSLMVELKSNTNERDLFIKQNFKFLEKHKESIPIFNWLLITYDNYLTELEKPYVKNIDSDEEPYNSIKKRYNLYYNRTQKMLRYLNSLYLREKLKHDKERAFKSTTLYKRYKKYTNSLENLWFVKGVKLIKENDNIFLNIEPGYDISNPKIKTYFEERVKIAFNKVLEQNTIEGIHDNLNIPKFYITTDTQDNNSKSLIKRTSFPLKVNNIKEKLKYTNVTHFITDFEEFDYLFFKEKNKSNDIRLIYCTTNDGTVIYTARVTFTEDLKSIKNIIFIFKRYPIFDNKYKPEGIHDDANIKYIMDQAEAKAKEILMTILIKNI